MAYAPTGMDSRSTSLSHHRSTYYSSKALDQLRMVFRFGDVCKDDMIPKRNGRSIQHYRWDNLTHNVTPAVDGTVGTSGTVSNNILGAELSQFSAFISASSFIVDTTIDPLVEEMSDQLGYQAGQTVDRLTRDIIDAYSSSVGYTLFGTYPTAADLRGLAATLHGANIKPFEDGDFRVIVHPYTFFDIVNDPAANGYADIFKYTAGAPALKSGYDVRTAAAGQWGGFKVQTTTNVKVTSGSPNTYRMYFFGYGGIGKASLEGWGPSSVMDPTKQQFKINVIPGGKFAPYDPTAEIGGMVSYKFAYVAYLLDGPWGSGSDNYRYRIAECPTVLGL